jgi:S-adenosylmethionine-dependent methyltransferase
MMKNLVRGNFSRVLKKQLAGFPGSLTPTQPLSPEKVNHWLEALPLDILCRSGIRCFHDYILDPIIQQHSPEELLEVEMQLSQQEPFLSLARYIHVLGKKLVACDIE